MPETVEELTLLHKLGEQRTKLVDAQASLVEQRQNARDEFDAREQGDNVPTDEQRSAHEAAEVAYQDQFDAREREIAEIDRRIREQEAIERRRQQAAHASKGELRVTAEPLTYRRDNERHVSYFADLAVVTVPSVASRIDDPAGARGRLERHAAEMNVELPKRDQAREERAQRALEEAEARSTRGVRRGFTESPFERRVNPNRTDGQGGYFVPPLWLVDEYIPGLRAGRVAAGLARNMDLPEGTDSINIPKLSTLTKVDVQTADNAAVASQDFTDTSVSAGVKTIAGQEDVAIQLIEQSPGQIIDRVVMEDLLADYNRKVDLQVLSGSGSSGQIQGIYPSTNWSASTVTYTKGSPVAQDLYGVAGQMASQLATQRFDLTGVHFLMHPRRWFWFASGLDSTNRPLVESNGFGPYNVAALAAGDVPDEGLAGRMPILPQANVYIDANVTTADTTGGGTGQDVALAAKWDDVWLFEGNLRTRVLPEILSGTLEVRFQAYNYVALLVRYGQSLVIAGGSGFAAPAGF